MFEQEVVNNASEPKLYIERISSSLLVLCKLIEGAAAAYILYGFVRVMGALFSIAAKGVLDMSQALQLIFQDSELSQYAMHELSGLTMSGIALPFIFWIGIILVCIAALVLVVAEAIALLLLRIAGKGASFIRVVHFIDMGVWIAVTVMFVIFFVLSFVDIMSQDSAAVDSSNRNILLGGLIFSLVNTLIILLLNLCYHKDIAIAMGTVAYEVETGDLGQLKKTHLSGISFVFALFYAIIVLFFVSELDDGLRYYGVSSDNRFALEFFIIGTPVVAMAKYLSVCFCNRNLKHAR